MNDRIQELEIQCWEPRQYGPAWFNAKKFAELIVRECIEICNNTNGASYLNGVYAGRQIKEHFGVEL